MEFWAGEDIFLHGVNIVITLFKVNILVHVLGGLSTVEMVEVPEVLGSRSAWRAGMIELRE